MNTLCSHPHLHYYLFLNLRWPLQSLQFGPPFPLFPIKKVISILYFLHENFFKYWWNWRFVHCPSIGPKWFCLLDRPNCSGWVQIVLVGSKIFGQVQIRLFRTNFYNLDQSKMIWTRPKQTGPFQNELDTSTMIGTRPKLFGRSKIILNP